MSWAFTWVHGRTDCISCGIPLAVGSIRKRVLERRSLGHSNIQITLGVYTHLAEGGEDTVTETVLYRPLAPTLAPEHVN